MNRQLNEQEKELTNKGIERVNKEKENYTKALDAIVYHKAFLDLKRNYDDYMRPINRDKEDKEIETTINGYTSEIKMCAEKLENLNEQLKDGVAVKEPPIGV